VSDLLDRILPALAEGEEPLGGAIRPSPSAGAEQTTLLPEGQRTAEQEQALGVDIFGVPESESAVPGSDASSSTEDASPQEEGESDGGAPSSASLDPIVVLAGEMKIVRGSAAGKTVAEVVRDDPERCITYLKNGRDEKLKAAIQTFLYAVYPDLMEEEL
jgi:hypothetical protein